MRAAMRKRQPDAEDLAEAEKKKKRPVRSSQSKAGEAKENEQAHIGDQAAAGDLTEDMIIKPINVGEDEEDPTEQKKDPLEKENQFASILDRRPEEPLPAEARRERAYRNLHAVGDAMMRYVADKGHFPVTHSVSRTNGFPTLSWRVELLPYLGYTKLYEKFDFNVPWDKAPNADLLKYIPDEYVSPERFDTQTNIVAPVGSTFAFSNRRKLRRPSYFEDGLENTIVLLEGSDSVAVQWTKPGDLTAGSYESLKSSVGSLREDGAYAIWGNGYPTLLADSLSPLKLWNAFTAEAGDRQKAAAIHRPISIEEVTDPSIAAMEPPPDLNSEEEEEKKATYESPQEPQIVRTPVPTADQISAARQKVRGIHGDEIDAAESVKEKEKLAQKLLDNSKELTDDPAGRYVMQAYAITLASSAGDASTLVAAIDERIVNFEVDAYQENLKWLNYFGQKCTLSRDRVDSGPYIKRAIRVFLAGYVADDYAEMAQLARHCYKFASDSPDSEPAVLCNKLRAAMLTAGNKYRQTLEAIEAYRKNPEDKATAKRVGLFLCFYKGDWDAGLPILAEAAGPPLSTVVEMDVSGAETDLDRIAIGDSWWELSEQARTNLFREACMERAAYWYRGALPNLPPSLDRMHSEGRIDEFEALQGESPKSLISQLAAEYKVDLSTNLAASSMRNRKRR